MNGRGFSTWYTKPLKQPITTDVSTMFNKEYVSGVASIDSTSSVCWTTNRDSDSSPND